MSTDVKFDFGGALPLARELWQLADDSRSLKSRRRTLATTALGSTGSATLGPTIDQNGNSSIATSTTVHAVC